MSNPPTVGQLLDPTKRHHRDAIHVAILPVVAAEALVPGQLIGLWEHRPPNNTVLVGQATQVLGIVDPYLTCKTVEKGQLFYMFILPNTITAQRHEWTHPVIDTEHRV